MLSAVRVQLITHGGTADSADRGFHSRFRSDQSSTSSLQIDQEWTQRRTINITAVQPDQPGPGPCLVPGRWRVLLVYVKMRVFLTLNLLVSESMQHHLVTTNTR